MHPLTRQPTLDSVHSWWSDRNPVGPNLNLHAAAKPLMRFMYHRDASAFIRKHRGTPLSKETMEIYSSYLGYKYISPPTKNAILMVLQTRVKSENEAHVVADSLVLHLIGELFGSLDAEGRRRTCRMLEGLARHGTIAKAVVGQLVSLLRDENPTVLESATQALCRITTSPEGAQAAVDAKVLECVVKLLSSPNATVREGTHGILEELVRHENTTSPAVGQLVSLLRDENPTVIESVGQVLYQIATSPKGGQAVVDTNVLECVAELLSSPNEKVREWAHDILEALVRHETTTTPAVGHLISLLRGGNPTVIESVAQILYRISRLPNTAQAAVDANVSECAAELLSSPNALVRLWTCKMLRQLARDGTSVPAILSTNPCQPLVSLLRGGDPAVIRSVAETLYWIAASPEGAQAAVDANVLECMAELLSSPEASVWDWIRSILGELVRHETKTSLAVGQLVSLLRGGNPTVTDSVTQRKGKKLATPHGTRIRYETTRRSRRANRVRIAKS
ncbi:armadillo-type protein [Mycena capillaripes]|nr:armadillo-type protein [Mycena capillaripes]